MPNPLILMLEALNGKHLAHMRCDSLSRLLVALKAATQRVEDELVRRHPEHYTHRLETAGRRSLGVFLGVVLAAGLLLAVSPASGGPQIRDAHLRAE